MKRFVETTLFAAFMAALCIAGCQKIQTPQKQDTTAARVEKAMAAADITVADVATFLYSRGWNIVPANLDKPHWRPVNWAPTDRPAYYVAEIKVAVADTTLSLYLPQSIGPYSLAVTAYRGNGTHSDKSIVGYRDNGDGSNALPGVRP